jgi:hypothetical protein
MDFRGGKRVVLCTTPTSQHQGCGAPGALIWLGATLSHPAARKSAAHQNGAPGALIWLGATLSHPAAQKSAHQDGAPGLFADGERVVLCTTPTSQRQGCGAPGALSWLGATLSHAPPPRANTGRGGGPGSAAQKARTRMGHPDCATG